MWILLSLKRRLRHWKLDMGFLSVRKWRFLPLWKLLESIIQTPSKARQEQLGGPVALWLVTIRFKQWLRASAFMVIRSWTVTMKMTLHLLQQASCSMATATSVKSKGTKLVNVVRSIRSSVSIAEGQDTRRSSAGSLRPPRARGPIDIWTILQRSVLKLKTKVEKSSFKHLIGVMGMSHWKSESLNLCTQKSVCICLYLWQWIWEGVVRLNWLGAWVGRVLQCNTQTWCGRTSCASVCWWFRFAGKLVCLF